MSRHRQAVIVWSALLLGFLIFSFFGPRDPGDGWHWIWIPVLLTPALTLVVSIARLRRNHRSLAYWLLAASSIPIAAGGILSIVGWLFILNLVLLIWAARRENPAEEIVQF